MSREGVGSAVAERGWRIDVGSGVGEDGEDGAGDGSIEVEDDCGEEEGDGGDGEDGQEDHRDAELHLAFILVDLVVVVMHFLTIKG